MGFGHHVRPTCVIGGADVERAHSGERANADAAARHDIPHASDGRTEYPGRKVRGPAHRMQIIIGDIL